MVIFGLIHRHIHVIQQLEEVVALRVQTAIRDQDGRIAVGHGPDNKNADKNQTESCQNPAFNSLFAEPHNQGPLGRLWRTESRYRACFRGGISGDGRQRRSIARHCVHGKKPR